MAISKIERNTENGVQTLIDLTGDTVTPQTLADGATAHDASGAIITGTATPVQLVQTTGNSETAVMSQKAVTDALANSAQEEVVISSAKPTDPNAKIWINPDEQGGGGGGVSVQSDWNQTDETAADFIKNKPFGEEEMVLFPGDTVDVSSGMADIVTLSSAGIGNKVTVTINQRDVYECIVQECMGFPAIGNVDAFNGTGDTGEPFVGIWMSETAMSMMYMGEGSYIRLEIEGERTNMLPEKYYNKMAMLYTDGEYLYSDITLTTKLTADEFTSMMVKTPISIIFAGSFMLLLSGGAREGVGYAACYFDNQLLTLYTAEYTS